MSFKLKPISIIETKLGIQPNGPVQKYLTETCYKYMDKYVPADEYDLRTLVELKPNSITYASHYARYQYKGMREDGTHVVKNYTTPGTGPYWDKRMWSADKEKVLREVQNYINRGGK